MDEDRAASSWDRERAGGRERKREREVVSASRGRGVTTPERKGQQRSKNEDEEETHTPDKHSSFAYFCSAFNLRSALGTYFTTTLPRDCGHIVCVHKSAATKAAQANKNLPTTSK